MALLLAAYLAKRHKVKVTVVHVVEVPRALPVDAELPAENAHGEQLLDAADEQARALELTVDIELLQARRAGPAVVDEARALAVDLIVLGLPYHSDFGTFQLGETSNYVLSHAHCRVWLTRDTLPAEGGAGA